MRYSEIIGAAFYGIQLTREQYALVDAHFVAAAHHRQRVLAAGDLELSRFHGVRYYKHILAMMALVRSGDFSKAFDNTQRGLEKPEGWDPKRLIGKLTQPANVTYLDQLLPDPEMFADMPADRRYPPGDAHPYDRLLSEPKTRPADISLDQAI
jgi:hypothetical protein